MATVEIKKGASIKGKTVSDKLKKAVDESVETPAVEEKAVAPKEKGRAGRTSSGSAQVNERAATKRRLSGNRKSANDPFWYLQHDGELELVTNEGSNELLGVKEIKVFDPSDKQWEMGVLANCTLILDYVTIKGVQVRESTRDDSGAIYIQTQSRSWEKDGQKQYANDVELSRPLQAQLLSYIESMLEQAE